MCGSTDQAAHYHILGPKLEASSVSRHLAGLRVEVGFLLVFITAKTPFSFDLPTSIFSIGIFYVACTESYVNK
jgi:hypothetical protein